MSERSGSTSMGPGTNEIPVVRPQGATDSTDAGAVQPVPEPPPVTGTDPSAEPDLVPGLHATAPVTARRSPRLPRRGPLMVMGPWAPVAGGLLGLLLGLVAVLFLAGEAEVFEERLALVFLVLGLGLLGASGVLLGDEVRLLRQRSREATVRPAWVEATAGLLNGLTPARLLLLVSGFVLFLAAYVSRG